MRYVPEFIERKYAAGESHGRFRGTALFIDVSGFTHLMEIAFALGERGAEFMSGSLRSIFDPLVRAVVARDGTIAVFAGDAFTALFPGDDGPRASAAAAEILRLFPVTRAVEGGTSRQAPLTFNVRCGIDAGDVHWGITKDPLGRCGFYFHGEAIAGATHEIALASTGEVHISEAVRAGAAGPSHAEAPPGTTTPPENSPSIAVAFIQDEVLRYGGVAEIKPVVSVFLGFEPSDSIGHGTIEQILNAARDLTLSHGGTLNKIDFGDKGMTILCFFGAPRAIENPARSALRFAEQLRARSPIRLRAGIESGMAYSGVTGGELRDEWTCLGNCVNMSARLMAAAGWGEILCGAAPWRAGADHFEFTPLGERAFKGFSGKVAVARIERSFSRRGALAYEGSMIGRRSELQRLGDFLRPAEEGRFAGMVYVVGEAGTGKTRLVQEFRRGLECAAPARRSPEGAGGEAAPLECAAGAAPLECAAEAAPLECAAEAAPLECAAPARRSPEGAGGEAAHGARHEWVHLTCLERDGGLDPVARWLESFFGVSALTPVEEKRCSLEREIERLAGTTGLPEETRRELRRTISFLGALVGCHWERRPSGEGRANPHTMLYSEIADPKLRYENQLWAVKELVKALACRAPLVLEIEDAHWLEASTAEWLRIMTRNVAEVPFMVLLTSRDAPKGATEVPVETITLTGFDEAMAAQMFAGKIASRSDSARPPSPALLRFLMDRSGGNPFFLEQMTLHLKENGLLAEGPDGVALTGEIGRLPTTLDNLLLARFDRMEAGLRQGLKHAATLGVRFLREVLEELLRRSSEFSARPEDILPSAEREGMVAPEAAPAATVSAEAAYLFRHVLMQQAVYHLQMPSVRGRLHGLAGEVMEELFPDRKEFYREMAGHFGESENRGKETEYLEKAARFAAETFKNADAIDLYSRLISRLTAGPAPSAARVKARYGLAAVCNRVGRWTEATEEYEKGLTEAKDPEQIVDGRNALAVMFRQQGQMEKAMEMSVSARDLAETSVYAKGKADAISNLGTVHFCQGDHARALECWEKQLRLSEERGDKAGKARAIGNIGNVQWSLGNLARSLECHRESLRLSEEMGNKPGRAASSGNIGSVHFVLGDYTRALEFIREDLRLSEELGDQAGMSRASTNIGCVHYVQGDYARAAECYQRSLRIAEELGDKLARARAIGNMGGVYRDQGDTARAIECYQEDVRLAEELGDRDGMALALTNMGNAHSDRRDYARAMECHRTSLKISEQLGNRAGQARAIGRIGSVMVKTGDADGGIERLESAVRLWRELGARQEAADPFIGLAEAFLQKSRAAAPGGDEAQQWLARAREALGEARAIAEEQHQKGKLAEIAKLEAQAE